MMETYKHLYEDFSIFFLKRVHVKLVLKLLISNIVLHYIYSYI